LFILFSLFRLLSFPGFAELTDSFVIARIV